MTINVKATVTIEGNEHLEALIANLHELEQFSGKAFNFSDRSDSASTAPLSMFIAQQPLSDIVQSVLAAADAASSSHYTAPPQGQPWPERISAGTLALRTALHPLAASSLRAGAPGAITNRAQFWKHHGAAIAARFLRPMR